MTFEQLTEKVKLISEELKEHCDAVHIVMSFYEESTTHFINVGHGNNMLREKMLERAAERLSEGTTVFFDVDDNDDDDTTAPDAAPL